MFVDLTGKDILPMWLSPESVGGKAKENLEALDGNEEISSLARLGQALKGATESKSALGTINQWASAFMRYAPFAVANKHLSRPQVLAHLNTVFRLVEEERAEQRGPQVAILYEELARRHLEKRAHKSDPTLVVSILLADSDKGLLAAARQSVNSALKARQAPGGKASLASGSVGKALAHSHREEALQAARALQTQQDRGRDARSCRMVDSLG